MRRPSTILIVLAVLMALPGVAQAQRRGNGKVYGPGGLMYDTNSPEWRASGGNFMIYEQIMQEKALRAQQQAFAKQMQQMAKQQQAFEKWLKDQKARKDKGQATDPAYDQYLKMVEQQAKAALPPPRRARRKRSTKNSAAETASAPAATAAPVAKSAKARTKAKAAAKAEAEEDKEPGEP